MGGKTKMNALRVFKAHRLAALTPFKQEMEGVINIDSQGTILGVNEIFCANTGYLSGEIIGRNLCHLESKGFKGMFFRLLLRYLKERDRWQGEIWIPHKKGNLCRHWVNISALKNIKGETIQFTAVFKGISGQYSPDRSSFFISNYDCLTGLPNRIHFHEHLQALLEGQENPDIAVLFFDLDRLKTINNTLGYGIGDLILQLVAQRLVRNVPEGSMVARMGGDEFIILLEKISGTTDAINVAQVLLKELSKPFNNKGQELFISASIGITLFPTGGSDPENLIKNAEIAMDQVKKQGRNRYQVYIPTMNAMALDHFKLSTGLRRALEKDEFLLHYQPQIDMDTGDVIGIEALLRWQHPDLGLLYPDGFISIAEETGLIIPIGEWVLRAAALQNKAWQDCGFPRVQMAVNISARQFHQRHLSETIANVLKDTGLSPEYLELEITETVTMQDTDYTMETLSWLKEMRIPISIDDFGTGYCSLTYLRKYPFNKLKIDKTFIRDIVDLEHENAIVKAIIGLGHSLNLKVIAEGVETSEQMELLHRYGCNGVQGYLFGKPMPAEELARILT